MAFMLQSCYVTNSSTMFCATPTVEVPYSSAQNMTSSRAKRDSVRPFVSTPPAENEDQILDLHLGFSLDGVQSYNNLSDTKDMLDYAQIRYHTILPQVFLTEFDVFVPKSGAKIRIQVMTKTIKELLKSQVSFVLGLYQNSNPISLPEKGKNDWVGQDMERP